MHKNKKKVFSILKLRGAPSDLGGGGWADFLCRIFFSVVALGLQEYFLTNAGIFLSGITFA